MLDPELLEILVCPETREPVELVDSAQLARINGAIADGRMHTRSGTLVRSPLQGGLLRRDGKVLYPVQDEIPIMLIDEALVMTDEVGLRPQTD
jgi:uncharacterized protein